MANETIQPAAVQAMPSPAHIDKPFPFMRLPKELRLMVYERLPRHIIHTHLVRRPTLDRVTLIRPTVSTAILATSKEIHAEAKSIVHRIIDNFITSKPPRILACESSIDVIGTFIMEGILASMKELRGVIEEQCIMDHMRSLCGVVEERAEAERLHYLPESTLTYSNQQKSEILRFVNTSARQLLINGPRIEFILYDIGNSFYGEIPEETAYYALNYIWSRVFEELHQQDGIMVQIALIGYLSCDWVLDYSELEYFNVYLGLVDDHICIEPTMSKEEWEQGWAEG
ncbi:hypothetical protein CC80DRAFT_506393 [Byssothecium circinans]|uniref:2EXR domain-containing protein n=1 Tax=Byssothecium circinans TaxID=147558 RepID=A0A6A5TQW8_9PLEO|nr:hypothetical protein CC80DRAFT_506393 [Byssothecium circinans]